jgi:transposase
MTHDERGRRWLCPACARTHARDIEGKLPDEYW